MALEKRKIGDLEIAYRITGDAGARPIVLIHGLTASMRDWGFTVKPLAEAGWRVLTPDNPGHGESSAPGDASAYAMTAVADVQHALSVELGFAPAVVVGHSMGGAVAEEYAIRHGGDVSALVLVDSAGGSPRDHPVSMEREEFAALERITALGQGMEAVWELHQERGMWASVTGLPPPVQTFFKARFCRCSPPGYIHGDRQMHGRRNTVAELGGFAKPALVICGEHEDALMQGTSNELAAALPQARLAMIPKAGHSPQFENAAAFNAALLAFLKTV
jgi:pimeloyl-ACP methyl ester carboxylesterase